MKLAVNVNGVEVYSDKPGGISIQNELVTFNDGSTCNIRTREIVNRGQGTIRIGKDSEEKTQARTTRGPLSFSTASVRVSNLLAHLDVQVWDLRLMEVSLSGSPSDLEAISVRREGAVLVITCNETEGDSSSDFKISGLSIQAGRGNTIVSIGNVSGRGVVVRGGNVTVTGRGNSTNDLPRITVKVPRHTNIDLDHQSGNTTIGDTDGVVSANTKGSGTIRCGRLSGAAIAILGGTSVSMSEVNGSLNAKIMGSGSIDIPRGEVSDLNVQIMGTGSFSFLGVATAATLSIMGTGNIHVARVRKQPTQHRLGTGRIKVDLVQP